MKVLGIVDIDAVPLWVILMPFDSEITARIGIDPPVAKHNPLPEWRKTFYHPTAGGHG